MMIDLFKPPLGDTFPMNLDAERGSDVLHVRALWRAGTRSVAASAVPVAAWMMWRHGDGPDIAAAAVVTLVCAMVSLIRLRSPIVSFDSPPPVPDALPENASPPTALPKIAKEVCAASAAAIADDDLRQAEKMETIGRCVGEFAHDVNNLLTVIVCNLDRASRSAVAGTRAFACLADAALAAERAARLVGDILAFSRRQPAVAQLVDIDCLIVAMRPLILSVTNGCAVDFELGCTWRCRAAPNQLESALLNLVVNARDAMLSGGRLIIRTFDKSVDQDDASTRAGEYVVLAVSDTGVGMLPEVASRVLEPFFTTKPAGHGTGLGLSQIAGFARRAQGSIFIETAPGLGTCVTMFLPRNA